MNTPFNPADYRNASSRKLKPPCGVGQPQEELTFTPRLIYFAFLQEGLTSAPQPFTITNTGDLPVGIESVEVTGDFELVGDFPTSLAVGQSVELEIVFKPTGDGAQSGDVIVKAGTTEPQECVHLVGIGGGDNFGEVIEGLQDQLNSVIAVNTTQAAQITALQQLLSGFVPEVTLYMWRAYANSPDGRTDFTTGAPTNHSFIGMAFNKLEETPSENPNDYEWSAIGGTITNVISFDTENIAGRPAAQLITDFDALSNLMLTYEFNQLALVDWLNGLLYVDGDPVNTVITTLQNQVETADTALAETLGVLGATTPDGSAFILDLNKVYVDPDLSLSMKLSNMVAATATAQASVQSLQQAIVDADYAAVSDLALLGAKTLDGSAFILDLDTVKVSPTVTLSSHINSLVAAAAGGAASVTEIYEAVVTPEGGAVAKGVLQFDADGHVVGVSYTNGNGFGEVIFNFDSFILKHPGTLAPVFSVVGGVVKMTNVEIDTLKVGSVVSESIAIGAVTNKVLFAASYGAGTSGTALGAATEDTWAEFGLAGSKAKVITPVLPASSQVAVRAYVNMRRTGSDNDRVWFRLKRTNPGGSTTYVGDTVQSGMGNYATVFTYEWTDDPPEPGQYSYTLEYYRDVGNGTYYNCKLVMDVGKR